MRMSWYAFVLVAALAAFRPGPVAAQEGPGAPDSSLAGWLMAQGVAPDSVRVLDAEARDGVQALVLRVGSEGRTREYWTLSRPESRPDRVRLLGVVPAIWDDPSIEAISNGDVYVRKLNGYGAAMLHAYRVGEDGTIVEAEFAPPRPGPVAVLGDSVYAAWTHGRAQLALAVKVGERGAAAQFFRIEEPIEAIRRRGDAVAYVTDRRVIVRHPDGGWGGTPVREARYRPSGVRLLHPSLPQFRIVPEGLAELRLGDTLFIPLNYPDIEQFRRARPDHLWGLGDLDDIELDVDIGPVTDDGERVWFGLRFYDGEGHDGVGGVGWLDPATREAELVYPSEMADYSVSAIAVDRHGLLLGLAVYGEGAIYGAGLVRFDPETGAVRRILESAYVGSIAPYDDRIFATSDQGLIEVDSEGNVRRWQVFPPPRPGSPPPVVFRRDIRGR